MCIYDARQTESYSRGNSVNLCKSFSQFYLKDTCVIESNISRLSPKDVAVYLLKRDNILGDTAALYIFMRETYAR